MGKKKSTKKQRNTTKKTTMSNHQVTGKPKRIAEETFLEEMPEILHGTSSLN